MAFKLETFEIVGVVRAIKSGMTQPYLCQLADEGLYAVKGRAALHKGLIAEVVAGWLGQKLGVPIPPFTLADMPRSLLDLHEDQLLTSSIGAGKLFASLWQEPVEAMVMPLLAKMSHIVLAKVYAFDHWIMNGDRTLTEHGGNPNLMIELDSNSLIAIDHNLAFSDNYHSSELSLHACRDAWVRMSRDFVFCDELHEQMRNALGDLDEIFDQLPDQWIEEERDFLVFIRRSLARINQRQFWKELG